MDPLLEQIAKIQTPYKTSPPCFCYPGTTIMPEFGEISKMLTPLQINNIGSHTNGITSQNTEVLSEGGFEVPHQMERDYIWEISKMFYKTIPDGMIKDVIDGYFCGGGTEGNIEGLWIGREYLKSKCNDDIVVIVTPLTHYSIAKGAHILGINQHIQFVKMNDKFEMDVSDLKLTIDKLMTTYHNFLIVGTVGTTMCGSIDPISEINKLIKSYQTVNFYFHVDASFGGFTVPFVTNPSQILVGFENSEVKSIVIDADKMGLLPYPSGIFMCRKDLQNHVMIDVPYVGSHMDMTISGSRTFVSVACGWYYLKHYGVPWHTQFVTECIAKRNTLAEMLSHIKGVTVLPCSPYTNMLPISASFDSKYMNPLYNMRCDQLEYQGKMINVYKLCIFPHTFNYFDQFASDLSHAIEMGTHGSI